MKLKFLIGLFLLTPGSFFLTGWLINLLADLTGFNGLLVIGLVTAAGAALVIKDRI